LPREVAEPPSLTVSKTRLDIVLGNLMQVTLLSAESSSARRSPEVPASLTKSVNPAGCSFLAKPCYHHFFLQPPQTYNKEGAQLKAICRGQVAMGREEGQDGELGKSFLLLSLLLQARRWWDGRSGSDCALWKLLLPLSPTSLLTPNFPPAVTAAWSWQDTGGRSSLHSKSPFLQAKHTAGHL